MFLRRIHIERREAAALRQNLNEESGGHKLISKIGEEMFVLVPN